MENMIMDLVSLIADQVQTRKDLFRNEGEIMDSLMSSGYRLQEANAVLSLLQSLAKDEAPEGPRTGAPALRSLTSRERKRFTLEAFGFITKLCTLGIMNEDQREECIEKAMSLRKGRIELDEVKSLISFTVLADDDDIDDVIASARSGNGTVWN
jgi:Smg protein